MNITELRKQRDALENEIAEKESELASMEIDPYDYEDEFCDYINEVSGAVTILGMKYTASVVLQEIDPTGYRVSLVDWADSIDVTETPEYIDLQDEIEELESDLADVEYDISVWEDENDD